MPLLPFFVFLLFCACRVLGVSLLHVPCPTVYIYDFPEVNLKARASNRTAFGQELGTPGLFASDPFSIGDIIVNRLWRSKRCKVTRDPDEAGLFLVPLFHGIRKVGAFAKICESKAFSEERIRARLTHLTPATESKHVIIIPKGHVSINSCSWLRDKNALQKYALSHTYTGLSFGGKSWTFPSEPELDGRIVSLPYSSSFHWTRAVGENVPWKQFTNRSTRIHYIGHAHGLQADLRARLARDCKALGPPKCQARTQFDNEISLLEKQHSVFCLEPEGDSPYRKSVYDSIVSGCIPVLFSRDTDASSPLHWGSFHAQSRVLFSEEGYVSGKTTLATLLSMPQSDIAAMQASIAANAHRLQYSFDEMPGGEDAVEILLKKAALRSVGTGLDTLSA
jgi:hypothetical protein